MGYSVYVDQNTIYIINKDIKDLEGLPAEEYLFTLLKKGKITKMKKKAPEARYTYNTQILIIQHVNFLLIKALHKICKTYIDMYM